MIRLPLLSALIVSLIISCQILAAQTTPPVVVNQAVKTASKPTKAQISYSIGADLGENFKAQGIDIDPVVFTHGLKDALRGKTSLSQAQMVDILKNFQQQLFEKKEAEFKKISDKNKKESDDFLTKNKIKPGIITTKSGIQYKIIDAGNGETPIDNSTVTVMYTGKFINGTIFDQSKNPVTFPINAVIPGWTEVLKLMKPGAKFEVAIPPQLAYGEHGVDKAIGPNQTLIFNIHLLKVQANNQK